MIRVVWLAAFVVLAVPGCFEWDELYVERDELTQLANEALGALEFESGAMTDERCPQIGGTGPSLVSVRTPLGLHAGDDYVYRVVARTEDVSILREISVELVGGDGGVLVETSFDPKTGGALVPVHWHGLETLDDEDIESLFVRYMAVDRDGRCGRPLIAPFGHCEFGTEDDLTTFLAHQGPTLSTAFVETDEEIALVTGGRDGLIRVWDMENGMLVRTLRGHTGGVLSLAATRDGRLLLSGSQDHTARLWDLETGEILHTFGYQLDDIKAVAFCPEDTLFALGSWDGTVEIRSLADFELVATLDVEAPVNALAFAANAEFVAVGAGGILGEGRAQAWSTDDWVRRFDERYEREVTALQFDLTQSRLAVGWGRGNVRVWSVAKGDLIAEFQTSHADTITSLGFIPGTRGLLGVIQLNGFSVLRDVHTGEIVADTKNVTGITSAVISRSGEWFAMGDDLGQAQLKPISAIPEQYREKVE